MQKARAEVRESFRQSQTSLSRMSAGMAKRDGRAVRDALHEITAQQDRALRGFDAVLGSAARRRHAARSPPTRPPPSRAS
jgi:hypothetical protein